MDIKQVKKALEENMNKILTALQYQLTKMRTGRASPTLLDGITVDYYGTPTPIKQMGQISTPEARLLQIGPFDRTQIANIEKAILGANLGVTPSNDGNVIRIPFPALTEDKRKLLVKDLKKTAEEAKVQIRNTRRDTNDAIKKSEKSKEVSEDDSKKYQDEVQKLTDSFIQKIDQITAAKEKELTTV